MALLEDLKKVTPTPRTIAVTDAQGDVRIVAVPQRRKRWAQVIEAIEGGPGWERLELRGVGDVVIGYIERESEPVPPVPSTSPVVAGMESMLALMLRAQQVALSNRETEHRQVMQSMIALLEVQSRAWQGVMEVMAHQRDASVQLAETRAAAAAAAAKESEDGDLMSMLTPERLPQLMQMVRAMKMLAGGSAPSAPPAAPAAPAAGTGAG